MPCGDLVTSDDFTSGTFAACGGTTTVIDFANQTKGRSLAETVEACTGRQRGRRSLITVST
ncbi:MAG: hypothetical protein M1609_06400 [Firmicutes bacterium]|nr:hypothetical protein [Bacillota bacterium]MCL5780426.1 hypothetical protein [Bacillota bacterium]